MESKSTGHKGIADRVIWIGIGLGVFYWIFESLVHAFVFQEGTLIKQIFPTDGNELWMRWLIVGIVIIFSANIQAQFKRKQVEKMLWNQMNRNELILKNAMDGFSMISLDGKFLEVNPAICNLVGYSRQELLAMSIPDIKALETRRETAKHIEKIVQTGSDRFESKLLRKDGQAVNVEATVNFVAVGNNRFLFTFVRDISKRKQVEKALRNLAEIVSGATGDLFFLSLVQYLTKVLDMEYALIGELVGDENEKIRTIAVWNHGKLDENFEFSLIDTPCERVIGNKLCCFPRRVQQQFPHYRLLQDMEIESYIGTPLWDSSDRPLGVLLVMDRKPLEKEQLAKSMMKILGVRASAELERKRGEEKLIKSRQQLRNLARHLETIREEERTHISREIHDELGQVLSLLKMDLSWLGKKLPKDKKSWLGKIRLMKELIDTTIDKVRSISSELRPNILDNLGLVAAIEWQTKEFRKRTGIQCTFIKSFDEIVLDQNVSTALFRILQEALTNVVRHAQATQVKVSLQKKAGEIMMEIKDDGKGIAQNELNDTKSLGLTGIKERVHYLKGKVNISGVPNKGTTISASIPLNEEEELDDKGTNSR